MSESSRIFVLTISPNSSPKRGSNSAAEPTINTTSEVLKCDDGRPAVTHYTVKERFSAHTYINVRLETGRTHQIRVHFAYRRHALVGDPVYGGRLALPKGASEPLIDALRSFRRQALHAARIVFDHPDTGEAMRFEAPVPADMSGLLDVLREDAK